MKLGRVSLQRQLEFLHDLHEWLQAGRTPELGLQGFQRALENASRADELSWLQRIRTALQQGQPLGTGIQEFFSGEVVTLLNLGQRYGCLGDMLTSFQCNHALRHALLKGLMEKLTYPVVLLLVSMLATIFIGQQVLPRFLDMGTSDVNTSLQGIASIIHSLGNIFASLLPLLLFFAAGISVVLYWGLPRWQGDWRREVEQRLPFRVYGRFQTIWLLQNLAMFLRANVSLQVSLRQLHNVAEPYTKSHLARMLQRLQQGEPDIMKLLDTGLIDRQLWFRLQCQDQRSSLSERLFGAVTFAQRDLTQQMQKRQKHLAIACYGISAALVLGIFAAMASMFAEIARV